MRLSNILEKFFYGMIHMFLMSIIVGLSYFNLSWWFWTFNIYVASIITFVYVFVLCTLVGTSLINGELSGKSNQN